MLFEREALTPRKKLDTLTRLFHRFSGRKREDSSGGHVPMAVMDAHGELDARLRYMLEAASRRSPSKEQHARLRKIEKLLDSLPEAIMTSLPAAPNENWMCLYRRLVELHGLLKEDLLDAEEYATIAQKMATLAAEVSAGAAVSINGASMFTLLLLQLQLEECSPRRKRWPKKKKRKKTSGTHAPHPTKSSKGQTGI